MSAKHDTFLPRRFRGVNRKTRTRLHGRFERKVVRVGFHTIAELASTQRELRCPGVLGRLGLLAFLPGKTGNAGALAHHLRATCAPVDRGRKIALVPMHAPGSARTTGPISHFRHQECPPASRRPNHKHPPSPHRVRRARLPAIAAGRCIGLLACAF